MVKMNKRYNKNFGKMQRNIININKNMSEMKPVSSGDAIKRDELNELYDFVYKYDGTLGETALLFRENVKNYAKYVFDNAGDKYSEIRVLNRIIKSLTGDAQIKYSSRQGQRFNTLNEFYEWFDPEFRLGKLRKNLHNQLINWEIAANTQNENIVRDYKKKLNLFHLTTATSTRASINNTPLTKAMQITSIIKSTEYAQPEIYSFIDNWIMRNNSEAPQTLLELDGVIKAAVKYIETKGINSNNKHTDPTKISSVNAIQAENYSQFGNQKLISQYTNDSQYFGGNYNRRPQLGRGFRGGYNQRGKQSNGFGGGYNQRGQPGNGFRGNFRGGYSTRGRGRGQYGRCYYSGQSYDQQNSYGYGQRQGDGTYKHKKNTHYNVPYYKAAICDTCKIWGHARTQCQWIHEDFTGLVEEFRKMGFRDSGNKNRTVHNTQKQQKQPTEQRRLGDDSDN